MKDNKKIYIVSWFFYDVDEGGTYECDTLEQAKWRYDFEKRINGDYCDFKINIYYGEKLDIDKLFKEQE